MQKPRTALKATRAKPSYLPAVEALEDRCLLSGDTVIEWNQTLLNEIRANKTPPPPASRNMAIVQVAVFDAVNAIDGSCTPYLLQNVPPRDKNGSLVAAAAQAAHDTLVALYPQDRAALDGQLQADLAVLRDQGALKKGVEVGHLAAAAILQARANDGANASVPYTPGSGPGVWVPTPPAFLPSAFPQWPDVTPFTMTSGAEFRPAGPPALTSATYATALNEVKALGGDGITTPTSRTPEQTLIALFWADGAGTETPPGHWNTIAESVAQAQGNTLVQNARLFALLDLALADAAIVAWDAKYADNFWRPITAIRNADTDSNPDTTQDPTWTPLLVTPNFPSYTSGHSTFSSAAAAVLATFYGTDNIRFTTGSDFLPGVTRSFTSFSAAAAEAGQSRIYGGIHYQFDNQDALAGGNTLGTYVCQHFLLAEPGRSFPAVAASVTGAGAIVLSAPGITTTVTFGAPIKADGSANGHFEGPIPGVVVTPIASTSTVPSTSSADSPTLVLSTSTMVPAVDAKSSIAPEDVSAVGDSHTVTVTVMQDDGLPAAQGGDVTGFTADAGAYVTATRTTTNGAPVDTLLDRDAETHVSVRLGQRACDACFADGFWMADPTVPGTPLPQSAAEASGPATDAAIDAAALVLVVGGYRSAARAKTKPGTRRRFLS